MIEFDKFETASCVPGNAHAGTGGVDPVTCQPDDGSGGGDGTDPDDFPPPSDDPRCAEPAFYAANPDICAGYPVLILKPAYAVVESGKTLQYKTYLRAGGNEQLLSSGLTYTMSDLEIGVIVSSTGLFSGVAPGIGTVSVHWAPNNLNAYAQVEVTESCQEVNTNFLILIDNSESSKVGFNGSYATRLSYAKSAATKFADTVNYSKDKVGVASFNSTGSILKELSVDEPGIKAAISAIPITDFKTDLHAGLKAAMDYLAGETGHHAIVLFSDGENNTGEDPVLLADEWKSTNQTIIVIALRAWGQYFNLLHQISTGGFFLSAYDETAQAVIDTLKGLKTYLCSGDCQPVEGTYPMAQLNFNNFTNWDVFQGQVDLIGLGVWDVQPGNGLYLDLAGTLNRGGLTSIDQIEPGGLKSKDLFPIVSGKDYRLRIDIGGNNVGLANDNASVRVRVMDGTTTFLDESYKPVSHTEPLTQHVYDFTAAASGNAWIQIEMLEDATSNFPNVGPLIDDIIFENITDATVLLSDDFNNENVTVVPGGSSYYQCLTTPPGAQSADPEPPTPPVESV